MKDITYKCEKCGMSVKSQCAKCDEPLQNKTITVDSGNVGQHTSMTLDCDNHPIISY